MIVKWILDAAAALIAWVGSIMPSLTLPTFFQSGTGSGTIGSYLGGFTSWMGSFGNWIPVEHIGPALAILVTCVGVALGVKVERIVASFLTAGGGSAA
jgi:uncharacterized membrane protein YccF (DUF307 family)